jgi:hypothetical protein
MVYLAPGETIQSIASPGAGLQTNIQQNSVATAAPLLGD